MAGPNPSGKALLVCPPDLASSPSVGNLERCILYLRKAKDEGYASFAADLKKDQTFTAVLKDPAVQELLAPKPVDTVQP